MAARPVRAVPALLYLTTAHPRGLLLLEAQLARAQRAQAVRLEHPDRIQIQVLGVATRRADDLRLARPVLGRGMTASPLLGGGHKEGTLCSISLGAERDH